MSNLKPAPPTPLDVVGAEAANGVIATTERELGELEDQLAAAETAAREAERRADGWTADPEFHAFATLQIEHFAVALRSNHEAEMQALLDAANLRAQECVTRARIEADLIVSYARAKVESPGFVPSAADADPTPNISPLAWRAGSTDTAPRASAPPAVASPVVPPAPAPAAEPVPVVAPAPVVEAVSVPVDDIPFAPALPVEAAPSVTPGVVVARPSVGDVAPVQVAPPQVAPAPAPVPEFPAPLPEEPVTALPEYSAPLDVSEPVAVVVAPVPAPAADAPPPAPPVAAATPAPATTAEGAPPPAAPTPPEGEEFWPDENKKGAAKLLQRVPTFAVLQVAAVIVILIIVLMKIG